MISGISSACPVVFTIIWQSSLFIATGLIVSYLFKCNSARAHQALFLSMIAAVAVPFMTIAVKHLDLGMFMAEPKTAIEYDVTNNTSMRLFDNPIPDAAPSVQVKQKNTGLLWSKILLTGWITTGAIFLAKLIFAFILGARLVKKARPFEHPKIAESIKMARLKLGIKGTIAVYTSNSVPSPVIWCWKQRPILLLPSDNILLNDKIDLVGVLCHELAHFKRRDHLAGLFSEIMIIFLPWHPLLYWAKKRLLNLSEHACDDWVIAAGGCVTNYADSLLDLLPTKHMAFVPAVVRNKNILKGRITRMLKGKYGNPCLSKKWIFSAVLITLCISLSIAFAQTRPAKLDVADSTQQQNISNEPIKPMAAINKAATGRRRQDTISEVGKVKNLFSIEITACEVSEKLWKNIYESMYFTEGTDNQTRLIDEKFLMEAINRDEGSKILHNPYFRAYEDSVSELEINDELPIVTGYNEPDSQNEKATPVFEHRNVGFRYKIIPKVISDKSQVIIIGDVEYSYVTGYEEHIFEDKYRAMVPIIHRNKDLFLKTVPLGKSVLIHIIYNISTNQIDSQSNSSGKVKRIILFLKPSISPPVEEANKDQLT